MTREELINDIEKTYAEGVELVRQKNYNYAKEDDALFNFTNSRMIGVSPDKAILVRIVDKITRIANIMDMPLAKQQVNDERIKDSILDAINYLAILRAGNNNYDKQIIYDKQYLSDHEAV